MRQDQPWWLIPMIVVFAIIFFGVPGWLLLQLIRWIKRSAEKAQQSSFDGLRISSEPQPGDVRVVFHCYHGFIAYAEQTEYQFWAAPDDARQALKRLHYSNLIFGFFAYGALFIPILSYSNYLAQRRSIHKQERALTAARSKKVAKKSESFPDLY